MLCSSSAQAQVDTVVQVVSGTNAVPSGTALNSFGYDPVTDRIFTASSATANQALRVISNVSSGAQTVQTQMNQTAWLMFTKGGNTSLGGGNPNVGGFLLNPKPIPALGVGSYSLAVLVDQTTNITDPSVRADLSQKLYRYNLQQDTNGDARDEFTSLVTLAQMQSAISSTGTAATILRQHAWSGDGQSVYWTDSSGSTNFAGLWTAAVAGGAPKRLLNTGADTSTDINTEPAVLSAGGVDSIYFRGGGATGNQGGIDKITYDGTTASARTVAVPVATINDFLELGSGTISSFSMSTDADGNLYFNDTTGPSASRADRRGLYRLDPQGRLSKVVDYAERVAAFGGSPNAQMLTQQPRTVSYTNGTATFNVTQILYKEIQSTNSPNSVGGAYAFKVGDFNRDNAVDAADIALFKTKLTPKGTPAATADLRYDLNGNNEVSWKDVKVLQQFYGFYDGDANIDKTVDLSDFTFLAANFNKSTGAIWTEGDFDGDGKVDLTDFTYLASNFNKTAPADAVARGAAVPEPTALGIGAVTLMLGLRRRWR